MIVPDIFSFSENRLMNRFEQVGGERLVIGDRNYPETGLYSEFMNDHYHHPSANRILDTSLLMPKLSDIF